MSEPLPVRQAEVDTCFILNAYLYSVSLKISMDMLGRLFLVLGFFPSNTFIAPPLPSGCRFLLENQLLALWGGIVDSLLFIAAFEEFCHFCHFNYTLAWCAPLESLSCLGPSVTLHLRVCFHPAEVFSHSYVKCVLCLSYSLLLPGSLSCCVSCYPLLLKLSSLFLGLVLFLLL